MVYKINESLKIMVLQLLISFFAMTGLLAQSNVANKYGLFVVNDIKLLQQEIVADSNKKLIDLQNAIPALVIDLRYASVHNFMHRKLYPTLHTTYLRLPAANALQKVEADLQSHQLTLKIFDAYRPYSVTEEMWEAVKDSRYAADPSRGSGHNRGIAVDLTLIDFHTKKELRMGTGFDNFSDTAHQDFTELPGDILENRRLLKTVMEKYGFISLDTEWWHFSLPDINNFELLNVSFGALKKMNH
ncbi:MAG: M15 family metallopeptidase [Ginsengibacter sp.]